MRDLHVEYPDVRVPSGRRQGFTITSAEVVFRGLCADCGDHRSPHPSSSDTKGRHVHA